MDGNISLDLNTHYLARIESPGEHFLTYKKILLLGADTESGRAVIENLEEEHGKVSDFRGWRKGWTRVLTQLENLKKSHLITFINDPQSIDLVFNKRKTQDYLSALGIKCPAQLKNCHNYSDLIRKMEREQLSQVFLKPIAGSSASGVMAFRYHNQEKQILYTTLLKKGNSFYNSLRINTYRNQEEIKTIINVFFEQELIVEKWIPKWRHNTQTIDFRVIVINGKAEFVLPRGSKHTITNLHLGNAKLTIENSGISALQLTRIKKLAEQTMAHFPSLFYAGLDVVLDRQGQKEYVLEINAFGDLLLNLKNEDGLSVYEVEYEKLKRRYDLNGI